mgnify:CR=1 FL=1
MAHKEVLYKDFFQHLRSIKDIPVLQKVVADPERFDSLKKKLITFMSDFLADPYSPEIFARAETIAKRHLELEISPDYFKEGLFAIWKAFNHEIESTANNEEKRSAMRVAFTRLIFLLSLWITGNYFLLERDKISDIASELEALNRIYSLLREINLLIFEEREDERRLFQRACEIMVKMGGFALAWIGLKHADSTEAEIIAAAGETEYLKDFSLSIEPERPEGLYPFAVAIQEGSVITIDDIHNDPRFCHCLDQVDRFGFASIIGLPLQLEEHLKGALVLYSREPRYFSQREIRLLEEIARDISLGYSHIVKTRTLEKVFFEDELTGLPNQRYLLKALEHELKIANQEKLSLILVKLDIDCFTHINAELGRVQGDLILREVGRRLSRLVGDSGTVARVGPDEFAFSYILYNTHLTPGILLGRVDRVFSEPFYVENKKIHVTASIGAALYTQDALTPEGLLEAASFALKEAKKKAPQGMALFSKEIAEKAYTYYYLVRKLEEAHENREFVLFFQPRIDLTSRRPVSLEALIRWQSPERGLVSPGEFIPVLEESGLIVEVGRWVILEAARTLKELRKEFPDLHLSFNVSVKQFLAKDLLFSALEEAIYETGIPGSALEMEITESLLFEVGENGHGILEEIAQIFGLEMALDDFGTGYSSFAYLKKIPVRILKIDYSFVRELPHSREDAEVVMAIVSMARNLGKRLVAEGVERKEQLAFLTGLGVDEVQGFLFAKPMPVAEVRTFLKNFDPDKSFW